jgi:rhamnosyltransferase
MNRILFFVHYHRYDGLSAHVLYMLTQIKKIYSRIVFISNSPLSELSREKLAGLTDAIIQRENRGFDFAAWCDALTAEGRDKLADYDNVTLMNDTCFGPFFDLGAIYEQYEDDEKIDFWGMTKSKGTFDNPLSPVPSYLQSYFLCFKRRVINSAAWQNFWRNITDEANLKKIAPKYELQLTAILKDAGFNYTAMNEVFTNEYLTTSDRQLNAGVPFIKVKTFNTFAYPPYLIDLIKTKSAYPVALIFDYLNEILLPEQNLMIENKLIPALSSATAIFSASLKIAVHLHAYYLDVAEQYFNYFDNWQFNFDLYITTDTAVKKAKLEEFLTAHPAAGKCLKEIIITENRGRDILPWLSIADRITGYDIVGKFHTKKSVYENVWEGDLWQQELFTMLVAPAVSLINIFANDTKRKIGVIIPDIPACLVGRGVACTPENSFIMNSLWKKMGCRQKINFVALSSCVMPAGTMFWYRPEALSPLFAAPIHAADFAIEPNTLRDGTIAHAIEFSIVYVAWSNGYDYRIAMPEVPQTSLTHANVNVRRPVAKINLINELRRKVRTNLAEAKRLAGSAKKLI